LPRAADTVILGVANRFETTRGGTNAGAGVDVEGGLVAADTAMTIVVDVVGLLEHPDAVDQILLVAVVGRHWRRPFFFARQRKS
jgi:hypothetical protein